jgi:dipeptidyl aminopeptidase/acylaminoacyl peptidase
MGIGDRGCRVSAFACGALLALSMGSAFGETQRPVTVADVVTAARIAGDPSPAVRPQAGFAVFSSNGKRFVIVVNRPDLVEGTNDYSLWLFTTARIFLHGTGRKLATFSSSSNRAGISDVTWLPDNDTLLFLAARHNAPTQLYSLHCNTGELRRITHHPTSLVSYDASQQAGKVVYAAEKPETNVLSPTVLRYGLHVLHETAWDLILGLSESYDLELFEESIESEHARRLRTQRPLSIGASALHLSPDARYIVLQTEVREVPQAWSEYRNPSLQLLFRMKLHRGSPTNLFRYEVLDTWTGECEVLLDAPSFSARSNVLWSPDSTTVVLSGVLLPLQFPSSATREARRSDRFIVAIRLPDRATTVISGDDAIPLQWDRGINAVLFRVQRPSLGPDCIERGPSYWVRAGTWSPLQEQPAITGARRPCVFVKEAMNLPGHVVVSDSDTGRETTIFDLNPQFRRLAFGHVEEIRWKSSDGEALRGGLYLPPDYTRGVRYPLVIQTHGFDRGAFWIDGSYPTAFAAQPLASRDIAVLQIDDIFFDSLGTPREPERAMAAYESAVTFLDHKGIIDPQRVGLVGFSRTCFYVKYTLTHSSRHFAAAVSADGYDGGYLQYLFAANDNANSDADSVTGGRPFGQGLATWFARSPGFRLSRVETPVLLQALGPGSLLGEWEWFSGLRRLDKAVDLVYLPRGTHLLIRPWDRMVSLSATLDWLCYWLKGEKDPNPAKIRLYAQWDQLRDKLAEAPKGH